jgi:hypothetical protein
MRRIVRQSVLSAMLVAWAWGSQPARAAEEGTRSAIIAFSLQAARNLARDKGTDKIEGLGGIREVIGAALDDRTGDVILLGRASKDVPPVSLSDLVAVLRCAQEGGLAGPGVSLEPEG